MGFSTCLTDFAFDSWNAIIKELNRTNKVPYFKEGQIWWCHWGPHLGTKLRGGKDLLRPVVITKMLSQRAFRCIPLSRRIINKKGSFLKLAIAKGELRSFILDEETKLDAVYLHKRLRIQGRYATFNQTKLSLLKKICQVANY